MDGFRNAVQVCGFKDLGFSGLPYTWDNRQEGGCNIKVRLDRGLATSGFIDRFRDIKVWHVQTTESDHCCVMVECVEEGSRGARRFQYETCGEGMLHIMRLWSMLGEVVQRWLILISCD